MTTLEFILAAMLSLVPGKDHSALAGSVARVVESERPLFAKDEDRRKTAALVVAISFRESTFNNAAVSKTNDHCAMQIHARPELKDDADECIRTGLRMLRESLKACPSVPLGVYAEGPTGCTSARARRISEDRMGIASRLVREVWL